MNIRISDEGDCSNLRSESGSNWIGQSNSNSNCKSGSNWSKNSEEKSVNKDENEKGKEESKTIGNNECNCRYESKEQSSNIDCQKSK